MSRQKEMELIILSLMESPDKFRRWRTEGKGASNTFRRDLYGAKKKIDTELSILDDDYKPLSLHVSIDPESFIVSAKVHSNPPENARRNLYIEILPEHPKEENTE
jgi:hypothetical protein